MNKACVRHERTQTALGAGVTGERLEARLVFNLNPTSTWAALDGGTDNHICM
jgi:hypothetical protein